MDSAAGQNAQALRGLQDDQKRMQDALRSVSASNAGASLELARVRQQRDVEMAAFARDLDQIRSDYRLGEEFAASLRSQAEEKLNRQLESVGARIDVIDARLESVGVRVDKLANDVSQIVRQFVQGDLAESIYLYGLTIGRGRREAAAPTLMMLEVEVLTNSGIGRASSLYASVGRVSATSRGSFQTFDGASPVEFSDDNSAAKVSAGFRLFGGRSGRWLPYFGVDGSYYWFSAPSTKDKAGYAISAGVEMASRNSRSAVQLALDWAPLVRTDFAFNNGGNSALTRRQSVTRGWLASFRVSFH